MAKCEICNGEFVPSQRRVKTCSTKCSKEQQRAAFKQWVDDTRWFHRWYVDCTICGKKFITNVHNCKMCSVECRKKHHSMVNTMMQWGGGPRPTFNCPECGVEVKYTYGKRQKKFCSSSCSVRFHVRIGNARHRAKLRGATLEKVDPLVVFKRDGYICHLCGVKVDMRMRGKRVAKAPQVDHILPISKGGAHSYDNVACSCMRCNASKGSKSIGQMRLAIEAMGASAQGVA